MPLEDAAAWDFDWRMGDGQSIRKKFAQAFFAGGGVDTMTGGVEHPDVLDPFLEAGIDAGAKAGKAFVVEDEDAEEGDGFGGHFLRREIAEDFA